MKLPFSPLPLFLALPGELPIPMAEANNALLKAMLIHSLGSKRQCILHALGPTEKYVDCVTLLARHFAAPQSVIVQRIVFHNADSSRVSQSTSMSLTSISGYPL